MDRELINGWNNGFAMFAVLPRERLKDKRKKPFTFT
jgi:hypothetical protein